MEKAGVRILLIDTEDNNQAALHFFSSKHGFRQPIKHVYLDLNLTDHQRERHAIREKEESNNNNHSNSNNGSPNINSTTTQTTTKRGAKGKRT